MKRLFVLLVVLGITFVPAFAQDQPTQQQPSAEELEKEKAERDKNAYRLLDQVLDEAQSLRLTENRVRVQISGADMLWDNNQARARSLFAMAADGVAELGRSTQTSNNNRRPGPPMADRRAYQLRQELVLAVARHDAALAYQLLAATKPPAQPVTITDPRGPRPQLNSEDNLEQMLLGRVAALDPKLAAQNAEQMMEKGQYPRTIGEVITQLKKQDADAAAKLADKTVKKLQATNLLTNNEAAGLAQSLLIPGIRPAVETVAPSTGRWSPLEQAAYVDLLGTVVDLALKATPQSSSQTQNIQRGSVQRARPQGVGPGSRENAVPAQPTEAQLEQNGARRLLASLQMALPSIDQYLPTKAPLVRQKLSEIGLSTNSLSMAQFGLQGNLTADALVQAAAVAPLQIQSRLYQQAAFKALDEGNADRARQIATDHLAAGARDSVMQRIDSREMAKKAETARIEDIRQTLAPLQSDNDKLELLLQVASDTQQSNPKLSNQMLDEAKQLVSRRATSYEHFEQQLRVAHAFATIDPARTFEVLEPGISQLNELLQAASVLSGFEVSLFRDGEMSMQGGSGLTSTVNRFGQELALLARSDFERAETLAGRFQFPEPRILTRLAIVQGLLGVRPAFNTPTNVFRSN